MQKYQEHLLKSVRDQLDEWLDGATPVPREQVYRLVHSIKGTSATVGLNVLHEIAASLLDTLETDLRQEWDKSDLRGLFYEMAVSISAPLSSEDAADAAAPIYTAAEESADRPLVVVLDNDPALLMTLKDELEEQGWIVLATVDPKKAVTYMHEQYPDCFITDLHLPETDGFQVIETLLEKVRKQLIPTTVISDDTARETRLAVYRMGADDFMNKPLDLEELVIRIGRQLERKKWLDNVLFIDELTGAYNRKYMSDAYARLSSELGRSREAFSIAVLDLDFFKHVNDTYGHLVGDAVLAGFAGFIRSHKRVSDVLVRYGGEEFVLLLPGTGAEEAKLLLERMLGQFSRLRFDSHLGPFSVTFSGGVVQVFEGREPLEVWIKKADQALYQAKNNGRSRIELASEAALVNAKKKLKAAIVDDDAVIREMVAEYLTSRFEPELDVDLRTFRDGETFLDDNWHSGSDPVLVILDGIMPGIDGIDVLQQLRAAPLGERYMIIMLTGRKGEQNIVKALQLGADDYVTKPFSFRELEVRIERLVRRSVQG